MKMKFSVVGALAACMMSAAYAASIVYLNESGVTDLSDGAAWDGGVAPGPDDVAVFDGAIPTTLTIPNGTAWSGMIRTNIVNEATFSGGPLTLGADGVTSFNDNNTLYRTYLPSVVLAGAQTWTLAKDKTLCVNGSVTGTGPLTVTASGSYSVLFYGDVEPTGGILARESARVWAMRDSHFAQAPDMAANTMFEFIPDGTGTVAFADMIDTRTFTNKGIFSFGQEDTASSFAAADSPTVTLAAGDSIRGTSTSNSNRGIQQIRVQDTHVVSDGADVTVNSWFNIRSGSWTQAAGDTEFNYAAIVGRGSPASCKSKLQRLTLSGGTFTARRMSVGLANNDSYPAEVFVTGGSYASTLPNDATWAAALTVGQRVASGEEVWDNSQNKMVPMENAFSSARFEMTGGTVTTPTVFFGNHYDIKKIKDVNTASRFALRGGTLCLGASGIRPAAYWDSNSESHYDCVLSGGTFTFYKAGADSQADMRLSDRDGGTSFCTSNNVTNTRISGSLFGSGKFRKTGPGTLRLTGPNDYTNRTDVVEGALYTGFEAAGGTEAVWDADDFVGLGAGTQIGNWTNRAGNTTWEFQNAGAVGPLNGRGYSLPTVAATNMNGHAELAFDGKRAMFITGTAEQPISDRETFSIACVLRVDEGAVGGVADEWQDATVIMGCTINDSSNAGSRYGLALNADGCLGCGMRSFWKDGNATVTTNETLWSTTPVNDGKPHVVVWTWKFNGKLVLQVDDETWSVNSVSNGCRQTMKTRFIVGTGEYAPANTFRGTISRLSMARNQFSLDTRTAYARTLGLRYGVEAFAATPEPPAASTETVPAATATWTAESLTQTDGQAVDSWPEKDGKGAKSGSTWTFTSALADAILKGKSSGYAGSTASPVIARSADGHKLVSFNGTNACMALTGNAATPASEAGAMTVAAVVRFTGYGSSGNTFTSKGDTTGFLGESFAPANRQWLLTLTGAARVGACMEWDGQKGTATLRSARRFLDDGELHVLVVSYPPHGSEGTMLFALDGVTSAVTCTPTNAISRTRILLGGAEQNSKARYAPVDVAEFRFWNNVALTPDQVEVLTRELCAKYNIYDEGFERGRTTELLQQRSKEVFVHAGASYGAPAGYDFTLWPGQTIWGDGNVVGRMLVSPGAAVKVTATNTLHTADVDFADGSILKVECGANGAVNPLAVAGNVLFPDGTVTIDLQGDPPPLTPLVTWTGKVLPHGTTEFVPADPESRYQFRIDAANGRLVVAPFSGTTIIFR